MFQYEKKLQFPVNIKNPNPKYAPYRQMEKLELYRKIAMQLVEKGYAYECYCSEEELEIDRELQKQRGIVAPKYNRRCLHATPEQIAKWKEEGRKPCIRLKLQDHHSIKFKADAKQMKKMALTILKQKIDKKKIKNSQYSYSV